MPVTLSGVNLTFVAIVGVIAVIALVMAMVFRREVLAANDGTANMQVIARAVQEGASAYLTRQFRTLERLRRRRVLPPCCCCRCTPATSTGPGRCGSFDRSPSWPVRCSPALIGYLGMWLAVRANVRVASAARMGAEGRDPAMKIAFRTGAHVGMATVGSRACSARRSWCSCSRATRPPSSRASASARPCWPCSCGSAAASSPRPPTSAPTWSARSSRTSPRTTRATRRPSPTTSATTWATAPAWRRTCSSPTR